METYIRQSRVLQQLLELILDGAAPIQGLALLRSEYKAVLFPQAARPIYLPLTAAASGV